MPKKTQAWWVCTGCRAKIARPGKRGCQDAMIDHRRVCHKWSFLIEQVEE